MNDAPYASDSNEGYWLAHDITYSMGHGYLPQHVNYWDVYVVEGEEKAKVIYVKSGENTKCNRKFVPIGAVDTSLITAWEYLVEALDAT